MVKEVDSQAGGHDFTSHGVLVGYLRNKFLIRNYLLLEKTETKREAGSGPILGAKEAANSQKRFHQ